MDRQRFQGGGRGQVPEVQPEEEEQPLVGAQQGAGPQAGEPRADDRRREGRASADGASQLQDRPRHRKGAEGRPRMVEVQVVPVALPEGPRLQRRLLQGAGPGGLPEVSRPSRRGDEEGPHVRAVGRLRPADGVSKKRREPPRAPFELIWGTCPPAWPRPACPRPLCRCNGSGRSRSGGGTCARGTPLCRPPPCSGRTRRAPGG